MLRIGQPAVSPELRRRLMVALMARDISARIMADRVLVDAFRLDRP